MQAKASDRMQATLLRKKGLSYTEIQKYVFVSQASLSLWLRDVSLSKRQINRLSALALQRQKAAAQARHQQRIMRLSQLEGEVQNELPNLMTNPFFMLGLALYWAEGTKQKPWNLGQRVRLGNSDPHLLLLIREWFKEFCQKDDSNFTYRLYIHDSADIESAKRKWAKLLGISVKNIPYTLKRHKVRGRHMHNNYIGLVQISVQKSTWLNRRIELWTKGVAEKFLADA